VRVSVQQVGQAVDKYSLKCIHNRDQDRRSKENGMGGACSMNETILLAKSKGRSLGKITCIWGDNIKMGVK
jgi:hypothetical protein